MDVTLGYDLVYRILSYGGCLYLMWFQAGGDLVACETLPCQEEVEAIVRLVTTEESLGHDMKCWVTMACKDGHTLNR